MAMFNIKQQDQQTWCPEIYIFIIQYISIISIWKVYIDLILYYVLVTKICFYWPQFSNVSYQRILWPVGHIEYNNSEEMPIYIYICSANRLHKYLLFSYWKIKRARYWQLSLVTRHTLAMRHTLEDILDTRTSSFSLNFNKTSAQTFKPCTTISHLAVIFLTGKYIFDHHTYFTYC